MTLRLAPDVRAAGTARRALVGALSGRIPPGSLDTAQLLVSELVTNLVLHARTVGRLRLWLQPPGVRIELCDRSPAMPKLRHYELEAGTGRGLRLVDTLTDAWGVVQDDRGKCVWAEVNLYPVDVEPVFAFDVDSVEPL